MLSTVIHASPAGVLAIALLGVRDALGRLQYFRPAGDLYAVQAGEVPP